MADILADVALHSAFLVSELLLMTWAFGSPTVIAHPMTKVVGRADVEPDQQWMLVAGLAILGATFVIGRWIATPGDIAESLWLTLCAAGVHWVFTYSIVRAYFPGKQQLQADP